VQLTIDNDTNLELRTRLTNVVGQLIFKNVNIYVYFSYSYLVFHLVNKRVKVLVV